MCVERWSYDLASSSWSHSCWAYCGPVVYFIFRNHITIVPACYLSGFVFVYCCELTSSGSDHGTYSLFCQEGFRREIVFPPTR